MSSPQRPVPGLGHRDIMFWLPPGGTDNGVVATYWAELADLDTADVDPVLATLAAADVGGYVATPGGVRARRGDVCHRLWVDSLQYHRAEDVLMAYLHDRDSHAIHQAQKMIQNRLRRDEERRRRARKNH